jgi:hypothetical protein
MSSNAIPFLTDNNKYDLQKLLNHILEYKTYSDVAETLNVAKGTVKRWTLLNNVPYSYCFELMKLADIDIDYSKFSFREKNQFFTPNTIAKYCFDKVLSVVQKYKDNEKKYIYIEPSAGNGSFLKILPKDRRIGLDIEPRDKEIIKSDYFRFNPYKDKKYIVIGNPPFGLRGQLALKFINYSQPFADYVCFILPQLFESDGKGSPRKRVVGFNLVHSEKINTEFIEPDGKHVKVQCIFQVWSKYHCNTEYDIKNIDTSILKIYSLSDGGTSSTTRNKKMFNKCDVYLPSTCFGEKNMKYYESFDTLPRKKGYGIVFNKDKEDNLKKFKETEWSQVAFLSTNSAFNIRTSQITEVFQ